MNTDQALYRLADRHGILGSFVDLSRQKRLTNPETKKALLRANGVEVDNDAVIREALAALEAENVTRRYPGELVAESGAPLPLDIGNNELWQLQLEGGSQGTAEGTGCDLPDLPPGIHVLTVQSGKRHDEITLLVTPRAAPSIQDLTGQSRLWGVNAALYGLRSARNLGFGDFEDLACAAEATAAQGAGYLGINPIHAIGWGDTQTISPYSPSHRGFLNTLHIAADRIPGLENSGKARALLAARLSGFAASHDSEFVDYSGYRRQLAPLLEALFDIFSTEADPDASTDFSRFCADRGRVLSDFALFETLSEEHGPDWRRWPCGLCSAKRPGAQAARQNSRDRMQFHTWLQWLCSTQVSDAQSRAKQAGMPLGLYLDLAVGPRRGGAETWCESDSIAQGVSIGAPPDHLSPGGQNWNLAAFAPGKLAQSKYRAFRQVLRDTMHHAGILRIDHVLGMNRSFWIPDDGSPGGYIRQPFQSLLAVIAIEAHRARTAVIGEDLGLVPKGFREAINASGLYSYSVLQYEKDGDGQLRNPTGLRKQSLACFGTHDTPTLNGFRVGRDIDWWQKLGWIDEDNAKVARCERRKLVSALDAPGDGSAPKAPSGDLALPVHTALARTEVAMVSVQLDDLMGQTEAQNLPGTIDEHPNWRRRSAVSLEQFEVWPALTETGRMMNENQRGSLPATAKEKADET